MYHTCRDDANPEGTGHQHGSGVIGVNASIPLRPPDHPMQHLAEHAIPANTHDAAGGAQVCQAHQSSACSSWEPRVLGTAYKTGLSDT